LDQHADELASGLHQLGIQRGDRILVQLPNSIEFVVSCFALFRLGAIPILSMPASREADIDALCALAGPVAYITTSRFLGFDYYAMAKKIISKHASLKYLITDDDTMDGGLTLNNLKRPPCDIKGPHYRDTAVLLLSGGTTGTPKLIPRTHTDYAYNSQASAKRCRLTDQSIYLAVLPIAHNFPLACPGVLGTLSVGGRVVLARTTSYDEAFPLIEKERVTFTSLVPALVNFWIEACEWDKSDLSSLSLLQVGGSPLNATLAAAIQPAMGCRLQQVFGMAEGLLCYTHPDDPDEVILHTQGRPLCEDDEIRIVDEQDREVSPGLEGELLVRGPYTITGYYRAPEVNRQSFTTDGFYRSGDIARMTPEGNIQIKGRVKDQINRAGEKIAAAEIEAHLRAHPDIHEVALAPIPDEQLGERSCAFIMTSNPDLDLFTVRQFLQQRGLAPHKMPDQLESVEAWPLTHVGKINKRELISQASRRMTP
jgi:yersiniabactin salicyl-AMP ligase